MLLTNERSEQVCHIAHINVCHMRMDGFSCQFDCMKLYRVVMFEIVCGVNKWYVCSLYRQNQLNSILHGIQCRAK